MSTWESLQPRRALGALGAMLLLAASPFAAIVGHFHVSAAVATAIVAAITSGATAILAFYPWIIPVVGTLRIIILFTGTGAAIGF